MSVQCLYCGWDVDDAALEHHTDQHRRELVLSSGLLTKSLTSSDRLLSSSQGASTSAAAAGLIRTSLGKLSSASSAFFELSFCEPSAIQRSGRIPSTSVTSSSATAIDRRSDLAAPKASGFAHDWAVPSCVWDHASDETTHQCPHCSKTYSSASTARRHVRLKHEQQPVASNSRRLKCPYCHRSYVAESAARRHIRAKHPDLPDTPPTASTAKMTGSDQEFPEPVSEHAQCPQCPTRFPYEYELRDHIKTIHPEGIVSAEAGHHVCNICHRAYRRLQDLRCHKVRFHDHGCLNNRMADKSSAGHD